MFDKFWLQTLPIPGQAFTGCELGARTAGRRWVLLLRSSHPHGQNVSRHRKQPGHLVKTTGTRQGQEVLRYSVHQGLHARHRQTENWIFG